MFGYHPFAVASAVTSNFRREVLILVAFQIATVSMTMSSREIAELTGKQHKDVLYDIRNMLEKLGKSSADFSAVYKDQQLIDRPCFKLDRELTLTLVSGYDIPLRHRIVTRWAELENKQAIGPTNALSDMKFKYHFSVVFPKYAILL